MGMVIPLIQTEVEVLLCDWVSKQAGPITFEEAAEFLDMPRDSDGTYYGRATIETALENLGCEREVLVHFWPPAARLTQPEQPPQRPDDKAELQNIINIIRAWVLSQTEPFMISDIYSKPEMSEQLPCDPATLQLIHHALIALTCRPTGRNKDCDRLSHIYNPAPGVTHHVSRDEIYT